MGALKADLNVEQDCSAVARRPTLNKTRRGQRVTRDCDGRGA